MIRRAGVYKLESFESGNGLNCFVHFAVKIKTSSGVIFFLPDGSRYSLGGVY